MKAFCNYCEKEISDNRYIRFSWGEGILCKHCYEWYDKEIKLIEEKYKVKRFIKNV